MKRPAFTDLHATSGLTDPLPELKIILNQWLDRKYSVKLTYPEFTAICPFTGRPDHGVISIVYHVHHNLVEMQSLKIYLASYHTITILKENAVNRILRDFVDVVKPTTCCVTGGFTAGEGVASVVQASYGD